jgi:SAM-dependent methyltransferase
MEAAEYDAWYATPRGAWIGDIEFRLLARMLRPVAGESLLDVGCGTGYFTRRFAADTALRVVGVDPDCAWLAYARARGTGDEAYCAGRAERLPFADRSFDRTVSVTALCFVDDAPTALREILRVTRRRFAIGLLNRWSLLHRAKVRGGDSGAYRGARWHSASELRALFDGLPVAGLTLRSAIFLPTGGSAARTIERLTPGRLPLGAFIAVAGDLLGQGECRAA